MAVLDWHYVPGRGADHPQPLIRAYCEGCERFSRAVRPPTDRQIAEARERYGEPHAVINPDPPRGWENGCPRCDR
jgi:hypothetical protein